MEPNKIWKLNKCILNLYEQRQGLKKLRQASK